MSYYYYYHLLSSLFASNPNAARTPGDRFFFLSFALSFAAFNPQTQQHRVAYDDGDVREDDLRTKTWRSA